MYTAIFAKTYPGTDTVEILDTAMADGFEGVQFNLVCAGVPSLPAILPDGLADYVGTSARARGLRIAALSGTYNMIHPDAEVRLAARGGFLNVLEAARRMGAPVVTLCTGSRDASDMWKHHPDNNSATAWSDLRCELDFALGAAQTYGVKLGIEPEPGNVVCDAKAAQRLLEEVGSPRLGIILDAANLLSVETLPTQDDVIHAATSLLGAHVLLAHAKDIDAEGRVVAAGDGVLHLREFVAALRSQGFDGPLIGHGFGPERAKAVSAVLQELVETTS